MKKNNILSYVRDGCSDRVEDRGISAIDVGVLSVLSHIDFGEQMGAGLGYRYLRDIVEERGIEEVVGRTLFPKKDMELLKEVLKSERFRDMRVGGYVSELSEEREIQFAAVVYRVGEIEVVIFRGTDINIVGWKEDLSMAYAYPIPAQERAVRYMGEVEEFLGERVIVGGHSKGGNLALYASINCNNNLKERIEQVYSLDGPGFKMDIYDSIEYRGIKDRVACIIPKQSVIGLLLNSGDRHLVVDSYVIGMGQHDLYSWKVRDKEFRYIGGVSKRTEMMDRVLDLWIGRMGDKDRERLVEILFKVIDMKKYDTLYDFRDDWIRALGDIVESIRDIGEGDKDFIKEVIKGYREAFRDIVAEWR